MSKISEKELLEAGVHFGHLTRKRNPKMTPYIFKKTADIHLIDLKQSVIKIDQAAAVIQEIAKAGRKILFVATKKQAKDIVTEQALSVEMPFVTQRWQGGMLTNFSTIRKSIKKMAAIDGDKSKDGTYSTLSKKERLMIDRKREKLGNVLGGIADLNRLPAALFIVDVKKEHIAVKEAVKLNIPIFAMVDTNSDPSNINFPIPANDDAAKSIALIVGIIREAIQAGLDERKQEKELETDKESLATAKTEKGDGRQSIGLPIRKTRVHPSKIQDKMPVKINAASKPTQTVDPTQAVPSTDLPATMAAESISDEKAPKRVRIGEKK